MTTVDPTALLVAANRIEADKSDKRDEYFFPFEPLRLMPGVVPPGVTAPVLAMDYTLGGEAGAYCAYLNQTYAGCGFPGYAYLSNLATRAEFRAMGNALSSEMTRAGIEFISNSADKSDNDKIKAIEAEFTRLDVMGVIHRAVNHDANFGRAQIYIEIDGANDELPLIIDSRTVAKGSLKRLSNIEPIWTTPNAYNSNDPRRKDFYKPSSWFVLGKNTHASRLITIVTNELPDILKPAYNFGGIGLYQLAERYVDNWLRTQQSVSDLINNFSMTGLATNMAQNLQPGDDGTGLLNRVRLLAAYRSNKGITVLDKESEEIFQHNTPLSGLHELQAQSQEQMCAVSRMPAIILTGISPGGLNASSDSEIRVFYDWIASQQNAHYKKPLKTILNIVQLSLFGEIDPTIDFTFTPLFQMTAAEKAAIRLSDSQANCAYVNSQILSPEEVRDALAKSKDSGFNGIEVSEVPDIEEEPEANSEDEENE